MKFKPCKTETNAYRLWKQLGCNNSTGSNSLLAYINHVCKQRVLPEPPVPSGCPVTAKGTLFELVKKDNPFRMFILPLTECAPNGATLSSDLETPAAAGHSSQLISGKGSPAHVH